MQLFIYGLLFISLYFEVFLLLAFLEKYLSRNVLQSIVAKPLPTVAVVVPCFNEEKGVAETLHSLLALKYPKDKLEILLVDDGSTDRTLEIARGFSGVSVYSKANGGKHSAMNYALARTSAEFVVCLDADSVVEAHALLHMLPAFDNPRVAAVTPGLLVKKPVSMLQHIQKVEYRISVFNRFVFAALGSTYVTPGPFSIFRTAVIREIGGWKHAHATEDLEIALRLQDQNYLIANAPRALVYTGTPATLRALLRQRVRWTYGFLRNAFDYKHMLASHKYGNLGLIILPTALFSVMTSIFFFLQFVWQLSERSMQEYTRITLTESLFAMPHFSLFYMDTSAMWFLVWLTIVVVLALISIGSWLSTGSSRLPVGTPLFVFCYCFIVPLWLTAAVYRATRRNGVRWR
jgi:cellulose synthase/poly-beta-1,6-N-acetylglucosamine synthase-like glycosyltransferase